MANRAFISSLLALAWFVTQTANSHADPLDRWTWRYPNPQGITLNAVTYGNGQFVAVGDNGTIITSGDGYNWTNQTFGKFPTLLGVGYSEGLFAAVGISGAILTSSNAVDWVQQTSGASNTLRAVAGNSTYQTDGFVRFTAVGDAGTLITSSNGIVWITQSSGVTNNLNAVIYPMADWYFYVVGDKGTFFLNYGSNFFSAGLPNVTNNLFIVAANGFLTGVGGDFGGYVSGGSTTNSILYSTDLYHWRAQTFSGPYFGATSGLWSPSDFFILRGMAFGSNRFVAVGYCGHTLDWRYPGVVMTSDTGTNWVELPVLTSQNYLYGVTYGDGKFVAVGFAGAILVSTNGTNWQSLLANHMSYFTAVAQRNGLWIASGNPAGVYQFSGFFSPSVVVSTNGNTWTGTQTDLGHSFNGLAAGPQHFVGVNGTCIYSTTNGIEWSSNYCWTANLREVVYDSGLFVAVGNQGTILTSLDGLAWSNQSLATASYFNTVVRGKDKWVAAGGALASSPDGIYWTLQTNALPDSLIRIVYGNGKYAAVGIGQKILSSTDGISWAVQYTFPGYSERGAIAYGNGAYLAGFDGRLVKSQDGIVWTPVNISNFDASSAFYYPNSAPRLMFHEGQFIYFGGELRILASDNTSVPVVPGSASMTPLGFNFSFPTQAGDPFRVQATTNFTFWESIYGNTGNGDTTTFIDLTASSTPMRFFRVVSP